MNIKLTSEEQRAIGALKKVAKIWPKTLWLYSASGTLNVMRVGKDGLPVICEQSYEGEQGMGYDSENNITTINIPNDGGDW